MSKKFGIVIPVYNDQNFLKKNLYKLSKSQFIVSNCIIVIVDDSDDINISSKIIKNNKMKLSIKLIEGKRKYFSQNSRCLASRIGFEYLKKLKVDYFTEIDTDGAQDINDLIQGLIISRNNEYNCIIFSKYQFSSKIIGRSKIRNFISKIYTVTCKLLFSKKISDYSNSFRIYDYKAMNIILSKKLEFNGPMQNLVNLILIIKADLKIAELPCNYIENQAYNSSIKIKDLVDSILSAIKIIYRHKF
jgi:hypothetical protein